MTTYKEKAEIFKASIEKDGGTVSQVDMGRSEDDVIYLSVSIMSSIPVFMVRFSNSKHTFHAKRLSRDEGAYNLRYYPASCNIGYSIENLYKITEERDIKKAIWDYLKGEAK